MAKKIISLLFAFVILTATSYASPERIISTTPAITEILCSLGLEEKIIAVTDFDDICKGKEKIGGVILNREKILSLDPDLVIMQEDAQIKEIKALKDIGLTVLAISLSDFGSLYGGILKIGEATNVSDKADRTVSKMKKEMNAMKRKIFRNRKKVFFLLNVEPIITCGKKSFLNEVIRLAGGINAAGDINEYYPRISFEKLLDYDPEILIVPERLINKGYLESVQPWKMLSAVKAGRIRYINDDLIVRLSPKIVDGIKYLGGKIYQ
jgi:iron complex transport system substrate-binding protein